MVGQLNNHRRKAAPRAKGLRGLARRFAADKGANVLIMFGLLLPVLLALVGAGLDFSFDEDAHVRLQDATDAAGLAVSAQVVKNPNESEATLQTLALSVLQANYPNPDGSTVAATITNFHVCAPVQSDCNNNGVTMANDTVAIGTQTTAACIPLPLPTTVCAGSPPGQTIKASATTVIGFGATLQLNVVMDTSASMIVGSTPADVNTIAGWMSAKTTVTEKCGSPSVTQSCYHWGNWNAMEPNNQVADYPVNGGTPSFGNDNPPCAFACHDLGGSTTSADIVQGLTNATAAGATTRFAVMIAAANSLITNVQSLLSNNTNLAQNTYLFNIYGFNDNITQYGSSNMPCSASSCSSVTSAINAVSPGMDTYLNSAMQTFSASSGTDSIGTNGNGSSSSSPLKFMILVTDGLQSDRNNNWSGATTSYDSAWNYPNSTTSPELISGMRPGTNYEAGFDGPLSQTYCTALKNEGVILAVLETPYVPLDGMDPQIQPYEQTVRDTIYPGGSGTASAISAALQACASPGYYFQANSPSDISTGFTNLTTEFIQQHSYISQ
jgi:Flp pilus assembly protein TadG